MANLADELNQIGFLLGRAYYSYIGLLERRLAAAGLAEHCKPGMGSVLFALFRRDDRTFTELVQELQLAKSTMTGMVARMRKAGLVVLHKDADDRRTVRLRLTPLARSLESRCRRLAGGVEQLLCRDLSKPQQEQLRVGLAQIVRTISGELQVNGSSSIRSLPRRTKQ